MEIVFFPGRVLNNLFTDFYFHTETQLHSVKMQKHPGLQFFEHQSLETNRL